jgi:hypothetical protein
MAEVKNSFRSERGRVLPFQRWDWDDQKEYRPNGTVGENYGYRFKLSV